jgi:hypothetical protein
MTVEWFPSFTRVICTRSCNTTLFHGQCLKRAPYWYPPGVGTLLRQKHLEFGRTNGLTGCFIHHPYWRAIWHGHRWRFPIRNCHVSKSKGGIWLDLVSFYLESRLRDSVRSLLGQTGWFCGRAGVNERVVHTQILSDTFEGRHSLLNPNCPYIRAVGTTGMPVVPISKWWLQNDGVNVEAGHSYSLWKFWHFTLQRDTDSRGAPIHGIGRSQLELSCVITRHQSHFIFCPVEVTKVL